MCITWCVCDKPFLMFDRIQNVYDGLTAYLSNSFAYMFASQHLRENYMKINQNRLVTVAEA